MTVLGELNDNEVRTRDGNCVISLANVQGSCLDNLVSEHGIRATPPPAPRKASYGRPRRKTRLPSADTPLKENAFQPTPPSQGPPRKCPPSFRARRLKPSNENAVCEPRRMLKATRPSRSESFIEGRLSRDRPEHHALPRSPTQPPMTRSKSAPTLRPLTGVRDQARAAV